MNKVQLIKLNILYNSQTKLFKIQIFMRTNFQVELSQQLVKDCSTLEFKACISGYIRFCLFS
jgi:hypothetical protein